MDPKLIQQQVWLGDHVVFFLKTGQVVAGILTELSRTYVSVESQGFKATLLIDLIGGLQVGSAASLETQVPTSQQVPISTSLTNNNHLIDSSTDTSPLQSDRNSDTATTLLSNQTNPEITKSLLTIEAKYEAQLRFARLEPVPFDLHFPSDEVAKEQLRDVRTAWQTIRNMYDNAVKVHELDRKYGRIERIAYALVRIAEQYPSIQSFKRQSAYFMLLAGQQHQALEIWKKTASTTNAPDDWKQLATIAVLLEEHDWCCYSLEQYYRAVPIDEQDATWFIFIKFIRHIKNYPALLSLVTHKTQITDPEATTLFEAGIYLLKADAQESTAERYQPYIQPPVVNQLSALFGEFPQEVPAGIRRVRTELDALTQQHGLKASQAQMQAPDRKQPLDIRKLCIGHVMLYKEDNGYGFIRTEEGTDHFFHHSSISDSNLVQLLTDNPQSQPQVRFLSATGARGPLAFGIESFRSVEDMAAKAHHYAQETEYQKAATEMRYVLSLQPDYSNGQGLLAKWSQFAAEKKLREATLPKGNGYYARAKCVEHVEKDPERAVELYRLAVEHQDRFESAVKDWAMTLGQLGRNQEAINVLLQYRDQLKDTRAIDGLLMSLYQKTGDTDNAVPLLLKRAEMATTLSKRAQILWMIANLYLRQQEFATAEQYFRQVLAAQPGNTIAKRHIAISVLKQGRLDEAEAILKEILEYASDAKAAEMLAVVQQARNNGLSADVDILISTSLSDFFTEISPFTKFFLDHCDYKGVPPDRIQADRFNRKDVEMLEERASRISSRLPRDRSSFYLSAAKIDSLLEDSDPNRFYRYLCRSFASMGDAIVLESGLVDSACDLYCEALAVYDSDHSRSRDEQDAANALVRMMYATLGINRIPMGTSVHLSIDEAIDSVLSQHPNRSRVFRSIAYLIYRSRYAAARVLNRLFRSTWRDEALGYLRERGVEVPNIVKNPEDFARQWDALRRQHFEEYRLITNEYWILSRIDLFPAVIENSINRLRAAADGLFFDLDRQRTREFQRILEILHELLQQTTFEDKERLCLHAETRCRELVREIEMSPTKFSIEQVYPVIHSLQQKLGIWLEELYQRSTPSLTLRLAIDSYSPDNDRQIEVQIAIENQPSRSPAENVELLVVQENGQLFSVLKPDIRLNGSLRGGDRTVLLVPLQLTSQALSAEAFSMTVGIQYRTRSNQEPQMVVDNFSILLTNEFEEIDNPFKAYAKGGVVHESKMFYGRGDLITGIVNTLVTAPTSKSIMLYGQKRSGKSSILYHLKEALGQYPNILVLYVENIGSLLDERSPTPLLYQILWNILRQLRRGIRSREELGFTALELSFPTDLEFYTHSAPLSFFNDFFEDFKDAAMRRPDWADVRVTLLIDEFSYIYGYIIRGLLTDDFMKNWKALLQRNYFSVVLAGQDVMPKFIQRFPNEFGTIEDRQVGYLNPEDARALIDEPIRIGGAGGESRYREQAIERIIALTAGNPFYVQIICSRLVEHMRTKRQKLATKADVERIRDNLIHGIDALKLSDFENLTNSGDTSPDCIGDDDALQVLRSVAHNTRQTSTCARGEIICETEKPIDVILEDLVNRAVLECERGSYYRIRVGLFREWLRANL